MLVVRATPTKSVARSGPGHRIRKEPKCSAPSATSRSISSSTVLEYRSSPYAERALIVARSSDRSPIPPLKRPRRHCDGTRGPLSEADLDRGKTWSQSTPMRSYASPALYCQR